MMWGGVRVGGDRAGWGARAWEVVVVVFLGVLVGMTCQGKKYIVAPREFRSSAKPMFPGVKYPGSTIWQPEAAATDFGAVGSSNRFAESRKGPVARMMVVACSK